MEDWHNFGQYYDPTLMEWNKNLNANWNQIKHHLGDLTPKQIEQSHRMWNLYFLGCA